MSQNLHSWPATDEVVAPAPRRSAWRQRLIDAERGITHGFRSDSVFFVHFFVATVIIAAGFVLQITLNQWAIVGLSLSFVLAAEMLNTVLATIIDNLPGGTREPLRGARRIGIAMVFVSMLGAVIALSLVFGPHLAAMFSGT